MPTQDLEKKPVGSKRKVPWGRSASVSVQDALRGRRSVRAFLPTDVSRTEVKALLALAATSASNSNSQPWQVHVLTGHAKTALTQALLQAHSNNEKVTDTEYPYQKPPEDWAEPFRSRRKKFGEYLYGETLGIASTDSERRLTHHRRNYDFFGAPVGIFITVSRNSLGGGLIDVGLFLQSLMLAAKASGLDTCTQASFIDFYPVLREHLDIPDDEIVVCGVSLGYADPGNPLNRMSTPRAKVERFTKFYGHPKIGTDGES